jgi:secondary thiamine-phosphate synthase enzyme
MTVVTQTIEFNTTGDADIRDITRQVATAVSGSGLSDGTVTVFCPSATSGLTTLEYESGCISDLQRLFDEIADPARHYAHNARWGDGNGHSHVRAALLGPSLTVPFVDGRLTLGTWQQIIYVDFDNRSRQRRLVAQIIGEPAH